jgi:hypothetical protein
VTRPLILAAAAFALALSSPPPAFAAEGDHVRYPEPYANSVPLAAQASDSSVYRAELYTPNKIGMTLTNYGFIGNNFTVYTSSYEYPLGSGYEHLVRGGLWIGANTYDDKGPFTGVSTATVDGTAGEAAAGATEFTPGTRVIYRRSTLPNSPYFDHGAVSEKDYVSLFSDYPAKTKTGRVEDHRPLHVAVTQYNYAWSFSDYAHQTFFHYVITNNGPPLRDVWVGMYDELASGNMKLQSVRPPSGWFNKKELGWVDTLNMVTERYCVNAPIPSGCFYSRVPEVVGMKLLGVRPGTLKDTTDKKVTFAAWNWSPGSTSRDEDVERYALMSTGTRLSMNPYPADFLPPGGDPVTLVAAGPFPTIESGDSIQIDFAYLGSDDETALIKRAVTAQRAYDLNYIVPVPPPSPNVKLVVRDHAVDLYWEDSPEQFSDPTSKNPFNQTGLDFEGYRIYLGEDRDNLNLLAQFDLGASGPSRNDTTGFNTGLSLITPGTPYVVNGHTYAHKYTIDHLRDGFKYWVSVTSYDLGTPEIESLESGISQNEEMAVPAPAPGELKDGVTVFPNPYRVETKWDSGTQARQHFLWFANLPEQCSLKIYTLSGALIYETSFDGATYDGRNARGIYRPGTDLHSNLSGTAFGWDMITREGQAAATGLYLWAVEDRKTGKRQTGKFLLVKSDREDF